MSENTKKILMGGFMAALGAIATYALDALPMLAIPPALLPIVATGLGALINALRKSGLFSPKPSDTPAVPVPAPGPVVDPAKPLDWKMLLLKTLADALHNAVVNGDTAERTRIMGLIGDVEEAHA